jgi:hypothetical protein
VSVTHIDIARIYHGFATLAQGQRPRGERVPVRWRFEECPNNRVELLLLDRVILTAPVEKVDRFLLLDAEGIPFWVGLPFSIDWGSTLTLYPGSISDPEISIDAERIAARLDRAATFLAQLTSTAALPDPIRAGHEYGVSVALNVKNARAIASFPLPGYADMFVAVAPASPLLAHLLREVALRSSELAEDNGELVRAADAVARQILTAKR